MSLAVPNTTLTPSIFAKLTLMNLGNALHVTRNMTSDVTTEFGKPSNAKPGATVSVRKPYRFTVANTLTYTPQAIVDTFVPVTVAKIAQVGFEWDSVERTLSIREANELYAKPAGIALASAINAAAAQFISANTFNSVGTPGTTPVDEVPYLAAGDLIVAQGLPEAEELNCIINRKFSSAFVHGTKVLYNPAGSIGGQWNKGKIADATLGYNFFRDQTIYTRTVGPLGGTPLVDGTGTISGLGGNNGTQVLSTKGWTAAAASRLNVNDRFTIAGVYSVHPQTRQSTGSLQGFVVMAAFASDGTGKGGVSVAPAITLTGTQQNVNALPVDGAAITVEGAAGAVSPQGILMHKNAFCFISLPLANPQASGVELVSSMTDPDTGIAISFIRAFDAVRRVSVNRFDVLYDFSSLYKELSCAING